MNGYQHYNTSTETSDSEKIRGFSIFSRVLVAHSSISEMYKRKYNNEVWVFAALDSGANVDSHPDLSALRQMKRNHMQISTSGGSASSSAVGSWTFS